MKRKEYIAGLFFGLFFLGVLAPSSGLGSTPKGERLFMPNKGQWHQEVRFRSRVPGGDFFIGEKGFTYHRVDRQELHELHHQLSGKQDLDLSEIRIDAHAVKVELLGASSSRFEKKGRSSYYANFYQGKDPRDWAERVHSYGTVRMKGIYPGIDLRFEREARGIKYTFELTGKGDPSRIALGYEGAEDLRITKEGQLHIQTSMGTIIEKTPRAYQWKEGKKELVPCRFVKKGDTVRFHFPEGYRKGSPLLIDPSVIFASYTGSTSDNWGNTATFDKDGALYAGGTVFGGGYPTTSGAYQLNFGGGSSNGLGCDVSISKFAPDGSSLLYSTYLGGSKNELPHSLVVNGQNQLYVLGSTGSSDFPTDSNAAFPNFSGGSNGTAFGAIPFGNGTDAFISKFASDGTALLASTYMGGSGNDGLNEASSLNYNYGDILRGEVEVDTAGNAYLVSTTRSSDLPVSPTAMQDSLAGGQDAFVTKLSSDLSNVLFCSYYGGSAADAGYAIERGGGTGIYISGGTKSSDLKMAQGWKTSSQGAEDGFVVQFDASASSVLNGSYIGTSSYDQSYFVARDSSNNIFLYGQSTGTYPVSNASYSNPNSGQFIQKLSPDLSNSLMSTVFGTGSGKVDISPAAFMVSECNNIYLSGWGGQVNQGHGVNSSSTNGLPTTSNAYQSSTDGSDFYLMVLGSNASNLKYASFFGGGTSQEHVDGGTSRFDDNGVVYQAVCAGCGGNNDFPTTPGAHSSTNNSNNCNLAAFKFDMSEVNANIQPKDPPIACKPDTFSFNFSGTGGNLHLWDFGDGSKDTGTNVSHFFQDTGTYQVTLVVMDTLTCEEPDTAKTKVSIFPPIPPSADSVSSICPGDSVQLNVDGGIDPKWSPVDSLSDPNVTDPVVYPDTSTQYQVTLKGCATDSTVVEDTLNVTVPVHSINSYAYGDSTICKGDTVKLHAQGGISYDWDPDTSLNDTAVADPLVFPQDSTAYRVRIIDSNGCANRDTVTIALHPSPSFEPQDTTICKGDSVQLDPEASSSATYLWSPSTGLSDSTAKNPIASVTDSTVYRIEMTNTNGCSSVDSLFLNVHQDPYLSARDTAVCKFDTVKLDIDGDTGSYLWTPSKHLSDPTIQDPTVVAFDTTLYSISLTDTNGCVSKDTLTLNVPDPPEISLHSDTAICRGDSTELWVKGGVTQEWSPSFSLDDKNSSDPLAYPDSSTLYKVVVKDSLGCENADSIQVNTLSLPDISSSPDSFICLGDSLRIGASGGVSYTWTPDSSMSDSSSSDPLVWPRSHTDYKVVVTDAKGCEDQDTVRIEVDTTKPDPMSSADTTICKWDTASLWAEGGRIYEWTPSKGLANPDSASTSASPLQNTLYVVEMKNGCGVGFDSTAVTLQKPEAKVGPDTLICEGDRKVYLRASGGKNYRWEPAELVEDPDSASTIARAKSSMEFLAIVSDSLGCRDTGKASVTVSRNPELWAGSDRKVEWGSKITLSAEGEKGNYVWHPGHFFEDSASSSVSFRPKDHGVFWVELTDSNGCRTIDSLLIEVSGSLYAPNAFTPDGDGINDEWQVKGEKIEKFHLRIYDRWGELLFETRDMSDGWSGKVDGHRAKPDVYVYKIIYTEEYRPHVEKEKVGHITLVR